MIKHFMAQRYKNVHTDLLEFGRVNVLVGPNNSGKSNFLEALTFLRDVTRVGYGSRQDLWTEAKARGMLEMRARSANPDQPVVLGWSVKTDTETNYWLEVDPGQDPQGNELRLWGERLTHADGCAVVESTPNRSWRIDLPDQVLAGGNTSPHRTLWQNDPDGGSNLPDWDRARTWLDHARSATQRFADRTAVYHMARFDPERMTRPAPAEASDEFLDADGANLARLLRRWEQETAKGLTPLKEWLNSVFPALNRIWVRDSSGSHYWLQMALESGTWTLADQSDGTVKMIALATLLYRTDVFDVIAIDEPELNLHPAWQRELARWFLKTDAASQLFLSTHSPEMLDALTDGFRDGTVRLFVFNTEPGRPQVDAVTPDRLDTFFEEGWELGDVYRVGESLLGGWP